MKRSYRSDSHVHSSHSPDAYDPMLQMCEAAEQAGLYSITMTDHCECDTYTIDNYNHSARKSYAEAREIAQALQGRIHVYAGIELGQPLQNRKAAEDILSACDFDFVLGSLHGLAGEKDFYFLDYTSVDVHKVLGRYFDELLSMVQWNGFDSLAHITYPFRYIVGEHGIPAAPMEYSEQIDAIFSLLIQNKKALELNTSGLRQKIGQTLPPFALLQRFRQLGGTYVTIGSDAHRCGDVAAGLDAGFSLLQQAGFTEFTIYTGREPRLIPIP